MTDTTETTETAATPTTTELTEPNEPNEIAFHEPVRRPAGRSTAVRVGIVAGSALLVVVGVAAAMGASPAPSTGAGPVASSAPDASTAPGTTVPGPGRGLWRGPMGGFGMRGGGGGGVAFGGIGFGAIKITSIDGSNVSLKTDDGWTRTITVTGDTKITKGGATIAVGDLATGDEVRIGQDRAADGTYSVTALVVVLPSVAGQISAIDGNTLTITQPGGTTSTVHVDSSTTYQVNGAAGSLSDIKVGAFIVAEGAQRADGSLDAAAVRGGIGGVGGRGFPDRHGGQKDPNASPAPSSNAS